jgi:hypothetical protein
MTSQAVLLGLLAGLVVLLYFSPATVSGVTDRFCGRHELDAQLHGAAVGAAAMSIHP